MLSLILLIASPIVGFCNCSMLCCVLLFVHSSFTIISMGKRDLVVLLCLSFWCLVIVVRLFLPIPRVCLQFVIVVFPEHSHLLFFIFCIFHATVHLNNYHDKCYNIITILSFYTASLDREHKCIN